MPRSQLMNTPKKVLVPCIVFPGMFNGELQFQVQPPGAEAIHVYAANSTTNIEPHQVPSSGIDGLLKALLVQDLGDRVIIDLPGETLPIGPRIRVPKSFVRFD